MNVEIKQDGDTRIASIADGPMIEAKGNILIIHVEILRHEKWIIVKRSELDAMLKALDESINPEGEQD